MHPIALCFCDSQQGKFFFFLLKGATESKRDVVNTARQSILHWICINMWYVPSIFFPQ